MSEQERMQQYVQRAKIKNYQRYCMRFNELKALRELSESDICGALCLAFEYGAAKGYRAAKKAVTI